MMKKEFAAIVISILFLCGGFYSYFYYFIQTKTDYYVVMFTPFNRPLAEFFGSQSKLAQPKIDIWKVDDEEFSSSQDALDWLHDFAIYWKETNKDENKTSRIHRMIIEREMTNQFMLISITHTRNVNILSESLQKEIKKKHSLMEVRLFFESIGLNVEFYS